MGRLSFLLDPIFALTFNESSQEIIQVFTENLGDPVLFSLLEDESPPKTTIDALKTKLVDSIVEFMVELNATGKAITNWFNRINRLSLHLGDPIKQELAKITELLLHGFLKALSALAPHFKGYTPHQPSLELFDHDLKKAFINFRTTASYGRKDYYFGTFEVNAYWLQDGDLSVQFIVVDGNTICFDMIDRLRSLIDKSFHNPLLHIGTDEVWKYAKPIDLDSLTKGQIVYYWDEKIKHLKPVTFLGKAKIRDEEMAYIKTKKLVKGIEREVRAGIRPSLISATKTEPVLFSVSRAMTFKPSGINTKAHLELLLNKTRILMDNILKIGSIFNLSQVSKFNSVTINWTKTPGKMTIGDYAPATNSIRIFAQMKDTPEFAIMDTIWHELLHIRFQARSGPEQAHGVLFRQLWAKYPDRDEARKFVDLYMLKVVIS